MKEIMYQRHGFWPTCWNSVPSKKDKAEYEEMIKRVDQVDVKVAPRTKKITDKLPLVLSQPLPTHQVRMSEEASVLVHHNSQANVGRVEQIQSGRLHGEPPSKRVRDDAVKLVGAQLEVSNQISELIKQKDPDLHKKVIVGLKYFRECEEDSNKIVINDLGNLKHTSGQHGVGVRASHWVGTRLLCPRQPTDGTKKKVYEDENGQFTFSNDKKGRALAKITYLVHKWLYPPRDPENGALLWKPGEVPRLKNGVHPKAIAASQSNGILGFAYSKACVLVQYKEGMAVSISVHQVEDEVTSQWCTV
jgi:hypothetical protein